MTDDAARLVRRYWTDAWGAGKLDVVDELLAEPFVRHSRHGTVTRTRDEVKADLLQYRRVLRGLEATFHHQTVDGDRVWSRLTTTGVEQDSGQPHRIEWLVLHRVEGGRLVEVWQLYEPDVRWD